MKKSRAIMSARGRGEETGTEREKRGLKHLIYSVRKMGQPISVRHDAASSAERASAE